MMFEHHKKLKPKAKKEPKYLKYLHEVLQPPCFVCNTSVGIEIHHIKENSTDERIDAMILPLCYEHHHSTELSPHGTPKDFREAYPFEYQKNVSREFYQQFKGE